MNIKVADIQIPSLGDADFTGIKALVTVVVGEEKVEFKVPSAALCSKSPFFKAACADRWTNGNEARIELSEEPPLGFKAFLVWLYTGKFGDIVSSEQPDTDEAIMEDYRVKWRFMATCWVLGDFLQVPTFCNAVVDEMIEVLSECMENTSKMCCSNEETIIYIYSRTMDATSPLRRLVIDAWVTCIYYRMFRDAVKADHSEEFAKYQSEISERVKYHERRNTRAENPWVVSQCVYHIHTDEDPANLCPAKDS